MRRVALITLSYRGDFDRCAMLCASIDRYAPPGVDHYLIVDRRDRSMFQALDGSGRHILTVEEILPFWCRRIPGSKRWWMSTSAPPLRNWIVQQLAKLSVGEFLDYDVFMFIDSDNILIRPLELSRFIVDDQVTLFRVPAKMASEAPWHAASGKLLHLGRQLAPDRSYVGNLITWRGDHLRQMYQHISAQGGSAWARSVARHVRLSEYTIYGRFIDEVIGIESSGHIHDSRPRCHEWWRAEHWESVQAFVSKCSPEVLAVMISSKGGLTLDQTTRVVEQIEARLQDTMHRTPTSP